MEPSFFGPVGTEYYFIFLLPRRLKDTKFRKAGMLPCYMNT
jgi:hypothetical protein